MHAFKYNEMLFGRPRAFTGGWVKGRAITDTYPPWKGEKKQASGGREILSPLEVHPQEQEEEGGRNKHRDQKQSCRGCRTFMFVWFLFYFFGISGWRHRSVIGAFGDLFHPLPVSSNAKAANTQYSIIGSPPYLVWRGREGGGKGTNLSLFPFLSCSPELPHGIGIIY